MANNKYIMTHVNNTPQGGTGRVAYYLADTDAGKPVTGLNVGDLCWAVDTGVLYCAISSTAWTQITVAGAPAANLLALTGLMASPPRLRFTLSNNTGGAGWLEFLCPPSLPVGETIQYLPPKTGYLAMATLPYVTGRAPSIGDGDDPPAASSMGLVNRTSQSATIASTLLSNNTTAGIFRISYFLRCTTADVTAGTISVSFTYTDNVGATTDTSSTVVLTATTGRTQGSFVVYSSGSTIAYLTTLVGIIGTSRYQLRVRIEYLG